MGSKGNAGLLANFYILLNFMSLLLQLFATPKIQVKPGFRGGLMVLPLALSRRSHSPHRAATALSRSVLRVTEGGLTSQCIGRILGAGFHSGRLIGPLLRKNRRGRHRGQNRGSHRCSRYSFLAEASGTRWHNSMPLNTGWIALAALVTVAAWLLISETESAGQKGSGRYQARSSAGN